MKKILCFFILSFSVFATKVEITQNTGVYIRSESGKLEKIADLQASDLVDALGKTKNGKWVRVVVDGRGGWVPMTRVRVYESERIPASELEHSTSKNSPLSFQGGIGVNTGGYGLSFGVGAAYLITQMPEFRFDLGFHLYMAPSLSVVSTDPTVTGISGSAYQIMMVARGLYPMSRTFEIGGELIGAYWKMNFSSADTLATVSTSTTGIGIGLTTGYHLSDALLLGMGARFFLLEGTPIQVLAALEYRL